jgi:hypothetical protein
LKPFVHKERDLNGLPREAILYWLEDFAAEVEDRRTEPALAMRSERRFWKLGRRQQRNARST